METLAIVLFAILALWPLHQMAYTWVFLRNTRPEKLRQWENHYFPKTLVVISIRGADETFKECLKGILNQKYPDYDVRIIIDGEKDPAWDIVKEVEQEENKVQPQVLALKDRLKTCSLKCSALVQAVKDLDPAYQVVTLLDIGYVPHANYLKELIGPLEDEKTGASYGSRFYTHHHADWGGLMRYLWNASIFVYTCLGKAPMGGSCAIKARVLHESNLLKLWEKAMGEDVTTVPALQELGLKTTWVPSLVMVEHDSRAGIVDCIKFFGRQLLSIYLYQPEWRDVFILGLGFCFIQILALGLLIGSLFIQNFTVFYWLLSGLGLMWGMRLGLLAILERRIRKILSFRGETLNPWWDFRLIPILPLTDFAYAVGLLLARFGRKVSWRGVEYLIKGPYQIERLNE